MQTILLVQSLYNIVDSIFVARLSETALTAASLVYSVQFLMIAVGVGTAVGLNALLSRKIGEHKSEEACQAATTGLFLMLLTSFIFSAIGIFLSDTIATKMAADILLPTGAVIALCGTVIFWCFPGQLLRLFPFPLFLLQLRSCADILLPDWETVSLT